MHFNDIKASLKLRSLQSFIEKDAENVPKYTTLYFINRRERALF